MNLESQLKVQAWLDGELTAGDRRALADWMASDAEAATLKGELELTRRAMAAGEPPRALPESREFYWSKIEREILRQEAADGRDPQRSSGSWWKRLLIPGAALAALALVLSVSVSRIPSGSDPYLVETSLQDSGALTYRDAKEGVTLVWLSYPADKGLADQDDADIFQ